MQHCDMGLSCRIGLFIFCCFLISCSSNTVLEDRTNGPEYSNLPIVLNASDDGYGESTTKASTTSAFGVDEGIGVFAYYLPNKAWDDKVQDFMYNQLMRYDGSAWNYTPVKYWPQNGNVMFYGYYPVNTTINGLSSDPSVKWDNLKNADIMWAKNEEGKSFVKQELTFHHQLMRIRLKMIKGKGFGEATTVTSLRISGGDASNKLAKSASLHIKTGTMTYDTESGYAIDVVDDGASLSLPDGGYTCDLFVNPINKIKVSLATSVFSYPDLSIDLPNAEAGRSYSIIMTIHGTEIAVSVNNSWIDKNVGDQTIE